MKKKKKKKQEEISVQDENREKRMREKEEDSNALNAWCYLAGGFTFLSSYCSVSVNLFCLLVSA